MMAVKFHVALFSCKGLGEVFGNKVSSKTWPGGKETSFDGFNKGRRNRRREGPVIINGKVSLGGHCMNIVNKIWDVFIFY